MSHKDESDSPFGSLPFLGHLTYREIHAFENGLYSGFVEGSRDHKYTHEKHYWRMGYVAGSLLRYGTVLGVGTGVLSL